LQSSIRIAAVSRFCRNNAGENVMGLLLAVRRDIIYIKTWRLSSTERFRDEKFFSWFVNNPKIKPQEL
jgi:hypothetical protein